MLFSRPKIHTRRRRSLRRLIVLFLTSPGPLLR
jgi:hypothetical protein